MKIKIKFGLLLLCCFLQNCNADHECRLNDTTIRECNMGCPIHECFLENISSWDVSEVTYMNELYIGETVFNYNLSGWNVGNVTNMNSMFKNATEFNSDISDWNVDSVTNMESMIYGATKFNSNISVWDVTR